MLGGTARCQARARGAGASQVIKFAIFPHQKYPKSPPTADSGAKDNCYSFGNPFGSSAAAPRGHTCRSLAGAELQGYFGARAAGHCPPTPSCFPVGRVRPRAWRRFRCCFPANPGSSLLTSRPVPEGDRGELRKRKEVPKQGHRAGEGTKPPSCLTGDTAEAAARSVSRAMPLPGLFWCRRALQLGPVPAGKGARLRGRRGPSGRAGLQGLAAVVLGRCAKAEAGRLPRTFQCIHITIRSSRARASLPAARVGWEREREREREWLGWRRGTTAGPIRAGLDRSSGCVRVRGRTPEPSPRPGSGAEDPWRKNQLPSVGQDECWEQHGFVRRRAPASPGPARDRTASHITPAL